MITVNGVELPQVTEIQNQDFTIANSARNSNGNMMHDYINTKQKVIVLFGIVTEDERKAIYAVISAEAGLNLSVTYHDTTFGNYVTLNMYVGDRSARILAVKAGVPTHWTDLTLSFIEN